MPRKIDPRVKERFTRPALIARFWARVDDPVPGPDPCRVIGRGFTAVG
jgi:hypothetical protein